MRPQRHCLVLSGRQLETANDALATLGHLNPDRCLWVSEYPAPEPFSAISASLVRKKLGGSYDAVCIDLHDRFEPNLIAQCHGFIWSGGVLVLRINPANSPPLQAQEQLRVETYPETAVGTRAYQLFLECVQSSDPIRPRSDFRADRQTSESVEQAQLVRQILRASETSIKAHHVIIADRGRGKSSALGLFLAGLPETQRTLTAVTAAHPDATYEVLRFANQQTRRPLAYTAVECILTQPGHYETICIDEAAQVPVPILKDLVDKNPKSQFIFATTVGGYEGTGRGFTLRFLDWLRRRPTNVCEYALTTPIRWSPNDQLEALIHRSLILDSELDSIDPSSDVNLCRYVRFDRARLAAYPNQLRSLFGLLLHAHYRTTPNDLHRLLDAPNIELHGLILNGQVAAATMVALEGQLSPKLCDDIYWGRRRLRGHALPETLISHSIMPEAGRLSMVRSIRIAVHPQLRRRGLATRLIDHVHAAYKPDLFGTLFGATSELLKFRQSVGYQLVRLGASRGSRTGEPAAVMVRAISEQAIDMTKRLRGRLSRDLARQLALIETSQEYRVDSSLKERLFLDLPPEAILTEAEARALVETYAFGPRTQEAASAALVKYIEDNTRFLDDLDPRERQLIEGRILDGQDWLQLAHSLDLNTIPATMRALRRAFRALVLLATPHLNPSYGATHVDH